jgi:hypothetical protein
MKPFPMVTGRISTGYFFAGSERRFLQVVTKLYQLQGMAVVVIMKAVHNSPIGSGVYSTHYFLPI